MKILIIGIGQDQQELRDALKTLHSSDSATTWTIDLLDMLRLKANTPSGDKHIPNLFEELFEKSDGYDLVIVQLCMPNIFGGQTSPIGLGLASVMSAKKGPCVAVLANRERRHDLLWKSALMALSGLINDPFRMNIIVHGDSFSPGHLHRAVSGFVYELEERLSSK